MKRILFNSKYGLLQSVFNGNKTMTRRLINQKDTDRIDFDAYFNGDNRCVDKDLYEPLYKNPEITGFTTDLNEYYGGRLFTDLARYKVDDIIAVCQSYESIYNSLPTELEKRAFVNQICIIHDKSDCRDIFGWHNPMYVKAEMMRLRICIEELRMERLQDISDEDCMREGIMEGEFMNTWDRFYYDEWGDVANHITFKTPREAFASLIDKISGKGTWKDNPYVWAYTYRLVL